MWKFKQVVGQTEDPDLPTSKEAALNTDANIAEKQKMAKKRNAIAFANLTTAINSPSLIGILMRAQTTEWPSGLACNVIKQLFEKYEPKDSVPDRHESIEAKDWIDQCTRQSPRNV